ncbi:MAG: glycoside hydrolase family 25 protein [Prevotellaceae bacterium]|jgi:lysozyme|nr:glycoside hydrolase family 25 protein [Prevotellaceae bacterium]
MANLSGTRVRAILKKRKLRRWGLICLLIAVLYFAVKPDRRIFGIRMPEGYKLHGIDVSRYQDVIDWKYLESFTGDKKDVKISFAFIKATEGRSIQDPFFATNWENIGKTDIIRGAYHYFIPTRSASEQAQNFIVGVELSKGDLPPVLDIEITGGVGAAKLRENIKIWLNAVEKHYGMKPIIYSYIDFYEKYIIVDRDLKKYPLWVAHYDRKKIEFSEPWLFWQHSDKGRIPKIGENVDFNVFNGSLEELKALCKK